MKPDTLSIILHLPAGRPLAPAQVEACLHALRARTRRPAEWIVVAPAARPEGAAWLKQQPGLRRVLLKEPTTPGEALNQGGRLATGAWLVFWEGDQGVREGWEEALLERMTDGVGLVGAELWTITAQGRIVPSRGFDALAFLPPRGLLMARSTFTALDGFDGNLPQGAAADFCWRAQAAGYQAVHCSDWIASARGLLQSPLADPAELYPRNEVGRPIRSWTFPTRQSTAASRLPPPDRAGRGSPGPP